MPKIDRAMHHAVSLRNVKSTVHNPATNTTSRFISSFASRECRSTLEH